LAKNLTETTSSMTDDLELIARGLLYEGCALEKQNNFKGAVSCYSRALLIEPLDFKVWYFIHNNLGYSLIQIGDYGGAEKYCRAAIRINPGRHNAYKNLGLSLEGQDQKGQAIEFLAAAAWICPQDSRALERMEEIMGSNPSLLDEFGELLLV